VDNRSKITAAEWVIMEVIWRRKKASANQVIKALKDKCNWNAKTIRTLLSRLLNKQSIVTDQIQDRQFIYRPAVGKKLCIETAARELVEKVGKEKLGIAAVEIARQAVLTKREKTELRKVIKSKG